MFISPASYWEIAIKVNLGKWTLNRPYQEFIDLATLTYGFAILNIKPTHTANLIGLPPHHGDPFDRLLVAQALAERLVIVSVDTQIDAYGVTRLW